MNIKFTSAPSAAADRAARQIARAMPTPKETPDAEAEPAMAFVVSDRAGAKPTGTVVGPFDETWKFPEERQSFPEFMRTPGFVAAKQIWSSIKPAIRPDIARGVDAVVWSLETVGLLERWSKVAPWTENDELISLTLQTGASALEAAALIGGADGRPTAEIKDLRFALLTADAYAKGADPLWLSLHTGMANESAIYKAADGMLKVVEAGISEDSKYHGVKLNAFRDLASGDPKLIPSLLDPSILELHHKSG